MADEKPPRSVFELLRDRHEGSAWAYLEEVRNGTGFGSVVRTADALAMSLFPSRGLHLHGFEVKVSRADWVKELKAPAKADEIAKFCHYWTLVVSDAAIVKDGELPQPWGLLVKVGDKLKQVKPPVFNADALPPTYRFLGALLRKFGQTESAIGAIEKAKLDGYNEGWRRSLEHAHSVSDEGRAQKELDALKARLDDFEKVSGIAINRWTNGNVAKAVAMLTGGYDSCVRRMTAFAVDADRIAKQAREAVESMGLPPLSKDDE